MPLKINFKILAYFLIPMAFSNHYAKFLLTLQNMVI